MALRPQMASPNGFFVYTRFASKTMLAQMFYSVNAKEQVFTKSLQNKKHRYNGACKNTYLRIKKFFVTFQV